MVYACLQGAGSLTSNRDMGFLIVCILIFAGSLAAGCLPLFLSVDKRLMSAMTAFGAGLLVSTALAIILPEGMEAYAHATAESGTFFRQNQRSATYDGAAGRSSSEGE